jgi:hypothetical protein
MGRPGTHIFHNNIESRDTVGSHKEQETWLVGNGIEVADLPEYE